MIGTLEQRIKEQAQHEFKNKAADATRVLCADKQFSRYRVSKKTFLTQLEQSTTTVTTLTPQHIMSVYFDLVWDTHREVFEQEAVTEVLKQFTQLLKLASDHEA